MGTGCKVGQTYTKTMDIESNCPVSFEYEFKEINPHPDFRITPMVGDIEGNKNTTLTFSYTPTTFTTADAEY